ncbi:MAG: hypothetical protein HOG25_18065 [Gammaproteobacteria bacterium]|nr:hypothetical protein [Gammaproteobacteria bacterium]
MRPTHYILSSIGTHITITASCPATALQTSVSFITLSFSRLILRLVYPYASARAQRQADAVAFHVRGDRPSLGSTLGGELGTPAPPLSLVQARYIHALQQTLRATLVD